MMQEKFIYFTFDTASFNAKKMRTAIKICCKSIPKNVVITPPKQV